MRKLGRRAALAYRLHVNHLSNQGPVDLIAAAHGGLQDGSPLSALLSLAARVDGVGPEDWRAPGLSQVFGPRGAIYVVRTEDIDVFTLGLLPRDEARLARIGSAADQALQVLGGRSMRQADLVERLPGIGGTRGLRWAATAGGIRPTWDTVDTIVHPTRPAAMEPESARLELARRFFRYLGPATAHDLRWWLDGLQTDANETVAALGDELEPVLVEGIEQLVLRTEEQDWTTPSGVKLLPPDDTYINRRIGGLLVPTAERRSLLWPKAPPPGALVVNGEVEGTWRRRKGSIEITPWGAITSKLAGEVADTAMSLPLAGHIQLAWLDPVV